MPLALLDLPTYAQLGQSDNTRVVGQTRGAASAPFVFHTAIVSPNCFVEIRSYTSRLEGGADGAYPCQYGLPPG